MKRSSLRRNLPPKRPAYHKAWLALHPRCWFCGTTDNLQTHEIARGAHRAKALQEPAAWVRTCGDCHRDWFDGMPVARQLAHKLIFDHEHYDRIAVNLLRHRAPGAVTEVEVFLEAMDILRQKPEGGNDAA